MCPKSIPTVHWCGIATPSQLGAAGTGRKNMQSSILAAEWLPQKDPVSFIAFLRHNFATDVLFVSFLGRKCT